MKRYVAIDSGKFATKIAWVNTQLDQIQRCQYRTKVSHGVMKDDAIENGTYVCEINGNVYKIGNGALGNADLVTSKQSEDHKNCTLLALALIANESASPDEIDEFHVAIGIPVDDYGVVEKRLEYRDYILPDGDITITYRSQKTEPIKKTFRIVSKHVYPESAGALYLNPSENTGVAAVIDIGRLNVNATYFSAFDPDLEFSRTAELGGQILINNLTAELSSKLGTRCDERTVMQTLRKPYDERYLESSKPDMYERIKEESKQIIDGYLLHHVKEIKKICDAKGWALDYMHLIFVGGTSKLLSREIKMVFGDSVEIADNPEYANAVGFLRRMVVYEEDVLIPVSPTENN